MNSPAELHDRTDAAELCRVFGCTEEAFELATSTPMRRQQEEWVIPHHIEVIKLRLPEGTRPEEIDSEYVARHPWIVGSVDTVVDRLAAEYEGCGGFGTLLAYNFDSHNEPTGFRRDLELLGTEVAPRLTERFAHAAN